MMIGRTSRSVIGTLILAGVASLSPAECAAQDRAALGLPDVVELPDYLSRVLRDYERAWEARDADALAALFTADGYVLRPGHPPAHGRAAIREAYANSGGNLTLRAYDWAVEGSVGYIIGGYTGDPNRPESGKFLLAIRRDGDRWLIAADMDNGNN